MDVLFRSVLKEKSIRLFLQVADCDDALKRSLEVHRQEEMSFFWVAVREGAVFDFAEAMKEKESMF